MPSKAHGRAAKRSAGGDVGDFSADIPGAGAGGSEREVGCSGLSAVHRNALMVPVAATVPAMRMIFATEGTPTLFSRKSM